MRTNISQRTMKFLLTQGVILVGIIFLFLALSSAFFVRNATRWHLQNIEQDVLMFAEQAARSGEVPKRGDLGAYTFFILGSDGKYVLPRLPRNDESERLWQEYETKLRYEMQKQRDGWSYYPERGRWDWKSGQNVLRYVYIEKQGWIVAAEGFLPGPAGMLQGFLTPKLFMGLFVILCLACGLMLFNAFWHFNKVMKAVLKSQENNFIAVPPALKPDEEALFVKSEGKPVSGGVIKSSAGISLPRREQEFQDEVPPPKVSSGGASFRRAAELLRSRPVEPVTPLPEEDAPIPEPARQAQAPAALKKTEPVFSPKKLDDLGAVTIDTAEIRSPLLRKAIEEMRESRE